MIASTRMGIELMEILNNHCAKMNVLLWNCRGVLSLDFKRWVLEMMVNHFPSLMIITKTRVGGDRVAKIIKEPPLTGSSPLIQLGTRVVFGSCGRKKRSKSLCYQQRSKRSTPLVRYVTLTQAGLFLLFMLALIWLRENSCGLTYIK